MLSLFASFNIQKHSRREQLRKDLIIIFVCIKKRLWTCDRRTNFVGSNKTSCPTT
ncbi:hypothetical protein YC2023_109827 [Brassica napus]|uniref:(rape) hypothetical protein n=1 Tax=Brassica napus TaxID=3708 RepID=A0A816P9K0_BRANA|nr:unnamed protein product [Brassica napus]